jgi:phosphoenolpyruvate synthase/pyruvate phosphate dikinase
MQIGRGDLALAGGKGANLGEMARAGFPVPPGFCVTTAAYRLFLAGHSDVAGLFVCFEASHTDNVEGLRRAACAFREELLKLPIPAPVEQAVLAAWENLGSDLAYAVRSSATAEDLPHASFAGQQESYLNVRGKEALLRAIRSCWASLFTDRAVVYRARNRFAHRAVALCVVVQRMAFPDVAGALAGSAASAGVAEGQARVVLDPQTATLEKGEVLVAPGTDPGWTPLFLNAAGLVTEVGGLMTHGSVIAREYGIPAVVGVPGATRAIRTGQRVRVNGDLGYVEVLSSDSG